MPRSSSPGRALLLLALLILAIAALFDLARTDSLLRSAWRSAFRGETQMEQLRDDVIQGLPRNR